jgi:glycosyltransferase involved in cell wall biosynthesis
VAREIGSIASSREIHRWGKIVTDTAHILVNGLCIPSGGGFTVARELLYEMASQRPGWRFTLALSAGRPVHREFNEIDFPPNVTFLWAPASTANRAFRVLYENFQLSAWAKKNNVSAAVQLNGMVVPNLRVPTFTQFGDPSPYQTDVACDGLNQRVFAALKKREQMRAVRGASYIGWTSAYMRDLVCRENGSVPANSEVVHNGIPEAYRERARRSDLPGWSSRGMEILTVSNVMPHKRQWLVIDALAELRRRPGFESATYRIVGDCDADYRRELERRARKLGVGESVIIEGRVPQAVLEQRLLSAKVHAFMSVCECFGLPPVEAMAFGTPSIVADCCSAREIYGDAVEYCTPDDLHALVDKLAAVMSSEARAEELRRLGKERVLRYSWSATAARVAAILDQFIERPGEIAA